MSQNESLMPWLAGVWAFMLVMRTMGDFLQGRKVRAVAEGVLAVWTVALVVCLVTMTTSPVGAKSQIMLYWLLGVGLWVVALLGLAQKRFANKTS